MGVGLFGFTQKGSFPAMDMRPNGFVAQAFHEYGDQIQVVPQITDYAITDIFGTIHIDNQINASLSVTLKPSSDEEYVFTLYRGYKIRKITSGNEKIDFKRIGDYFYLGKKNVHKDTFTIDYSGFSPQFYSNQQGIVLPGYYPYYPIEGIKPIYDISSQTFDISYPKTKRFFDIEVISPLPLVSNIEQTEHRFQGESYTISLIGGNIDIIDEHFMIHDSNAKMTNTPIDMIEMFEADVMKNKKIAQDIPINLKDYSDGRHPMFIIPQVFSLSGVRTSAFLGDHYINTATTWEGSLLESDIPISKRTGVMRSFFIAYMRDFDPERTESWKSFYADYSDFNANDYIQQIDELRAVIDFDYAPNLTIVLNTIIPSCIYLIEHDPDAVMKMYNYLKSDHLDIFGEAEYLKAELEALQ